MFKSVQRRDVLRGMGFALGTVLLGPSFGEEIGDTYRYLLGDEVVIIKTYRNGSGPTYVCPHDNENTAVDAAMHVVSRHGGKVIQLIHSGERNISFRHVGKKYVFDPNRMFTDRGIQATLQAQGSKHYSREAHRMIAEFADVFLLHFNAPRSNLIVAMHNNTPGSYAATSYQRGGQYERDAQEVYIHPGTDPDDFFFVTDSGLFSKLSAKGFSVVLQARGATDDGSLSVYAASKGIAYVNVEAQEGHLSVQKKMLEALL